ncbi:MAG: hypothetical protein IPJ08_14790, partial [Burkholderiales bacterium]|nr:hypothetical protein [Burkholderiales bacterium]
MLDAAPWSANKLLRKGGKQLAWWAFALVTGFTFVAIISCPSTSLAAEAAALAFTPKWFCVVSHSGASPWQCRFLARADVQVHLPLCA